jgi:hypothetical protein
MPGERLMSCCKDLGGFEAYIVGWCHEHECLSVAKIVEALFDVLGIVRR